MMRMERMKRFSSGVIALAVLSVLTATMPAQASIIGTERMVMQESRAVATAKINSVLASAEVRDYLESQGVAPEAVTARIAGLSDAELQELAVTLESAPAGGSVVGVVGVVFVVLIVLELMGVTDVFKAI